jgi:hypothetical protein
VPDGVVDDDCGVSASCVGMMCFGMRTDLQWLRARYRSAGQSVVFRVVFEGDTNAAPKDSPGCPNRGTVTVDVFDVVRTGPTEKAGVRIMGWAPGGGRVRKAATTVCGECIEDQGTLVVTHMGGHAGANVVTVLGERLCGGGIVWNIGSHVHGV